MCRTWLVLCVFFCYGEGLVRAMGLLESWWMGWVLVLVLDYRV